jgi:hypothetical protein
MVERAIESRSFSLEAGAVRRSLRAGTRHRRRHRPSPTSGARRRSRAAATPTAVSRLRRCEGREQREPTVRIAGEYRRRIGRHDTGGEPPTPRDRSASGRKSRCLPWGGLTSPSSLPFALRAVRSLGRAVGRDPWRANLGTRCGARASSPCWVASSPRGHPRTRPGATRATTSFLDPSLNLKRVRVSAGRSRSGS